MKPYLLFPNKFRMIGWLLFIPGFILGVACQIWQYQIPGFTLKLRETSSLLKPEYENFTNELALALVVAGLLMTAFAKEKVEDELISKIRANSLYWAILVSSLVRLVYITLHSFNLDMFPDVGYTMFFIPLLIFKLRFRYLITRKKDIYALDNLYYLPNRPYRIVSAALSFFLIGSGIYCVYNFLTAPDFLNTLANFMFLPLIAWVYTKEEKEDEFIASLRVQSMQLAVIIYYLMLLIANIILYSVPFLYIISFSTEIIAIAFLIKFNWQLRKYKVMQGGLAL
ncbi:hypothetical protein [Mucilaginibacter auburnensis]|uniref:Uncharacterized protein n=1 Tax=Mucilaginibacter auburnensis TaxID=1457233 RepID=A0A2H9VRM4_9SPHI|nr:hypothetical protein [Mucilaginibacter auburnensis]PJJ83463.1 hypothetical protein CLV57_0445 [Mucilaginibacter auburnensis]